MRGFQNIGAFGCLLGLLLVAGCGKSKGEPTRVRGTVTVGGKALNKKGYSLRFTRTGSPTTTIAVADDGSFSGDAITGDNSVELIAGGGGHGDDAKTTPSYGISSFEILQTNINKGETLNLDFTSSKGGTGGKGGASGGH